MSLLSSLSRLWEKGKLSKIAKEALTPYVLDDFLIEDVEGGITVMDTLSNLSLRVTRNDKGEYKLEKSHGSNGTVPINEVHHTIEAYFDIV